MLEKKKSKHSDNFISVKKYYFENRLKVKEVKFSTTSLDNGNFDSQAKIVFDKNGEDIIIEGSESDFVDLSHNFMSTFRDGKYELIDLATTPAKNSTTFYKNMEHFISGSKDSLRKTIKDLQSGNGKLTTDINFVQGINACLTNNYSDPNAKAILENYEETIGIMILGLVPLHDSFEKVKSRVVAKETRFNSFMKESDEIFAKNLRSLSPLVAFRTIYENCEVDTEFLLNNFVQTKKIVDIRLRSLYKETGGKLDGPIAIQNLIKEYIDIYEIIRPILRDMAILIRKNGNQVDLNSQDDIIRYLKINKYNSLVGTIDIYLRNAGTHSSLDYTEKGVVKVFDNSTKRRKLIKNFKYNDIIDKHKKINELALALIFSYLMNERIIWLFTIDSPDFKFHVIENKPNFST
jgi:hypothetical protein